MTIGLGAVEEGKEAIVFLVRDGIELVIVALRAGDGKAEPDGAGGANTIHDALNAELLGVDAALAIDLGVAMKSGGDFLIERGLGHLITSKLFNGELVEGLVFVERLHDPVAIGPDAAWSVNAVAIAVSVSGLIQPPAAPALAIMGGRE